MAEKARRGGGSAMFCPCGEETESSVCKTSGGSMNCAASDGGTMAERLGFRKRLAGLSEGTPRPFSVGFLAQLARRSNLSALGDESATGDEPSKILIVQPGGGQVLLLGQPQGKLIASSW